MSESGLKYESYNDNTKENGGFRIGTEYNAFTFTNGKNPISQGTINSKINFNETGFSKLGFSDKNPKNAYCKLTGYFVPNESGKWKFANGVGGEANDDLSQLWFGDAAEAPTTSNVSFTAKYNSDSYTYTTPDLIAGNYYKVVLIWGQGDGGAVLGFGYKGPSGGDYKYDLSGYFYTTKPAVSSEPVLIKELYMGKEFQLVKGYLAGTIEMPINYRIKFKLYPKGTVSGWNNIMLVSSTTNDYDNNNQDSRNPGVWFGDKNLRMHVDVRNPNDGAQYCFVDQPSEGLTKDKWNTVTIDVIDSKCTVKFELGNGKLYTASFDIKNYSKRKVFKSNIYLAGSMNSNIANAMIKDVQFYTYDKVTDNTSCYYEMSDLEAQCYIDRYPDLKEKYGKDYSAVRNQWKDTGCKENRNNTCAGPVLQSGRYYYQGCYGDSSSRAIPTFAGNVVTVDECASIAEKNKQNVFGIQYGSECWTGLDTTAAKKYGTKFDRSFCKNMGGSMENNVYIRDQSFPPPAPAESVLVKNDFADSPNEGFSNFRGNDKMSMIEHFADSENIDKFDQLTNGNKQLYNQIFCDLYPTNNGFNTCTNCSFKGKNSILDKFTYSSEQACLDDCGTKKNCTSYEFDTTKSENNCTQYYTFPNDIDYTKPNVNSGYSLKFNFDFDDLNTTQKNNVKMHCSNQYLNNTFSIGENLNGCISFTDENDISKINVDPECLWKKMNNEGKPNVREDSVFLDVLNFTESKKDEAIDKYKVMYESVMSANVQNSVLNNKQTKFDPKFNSYNEKLEKNDNKLRSEFEKAFNEKISSVKNSLDQNLNKMQESEVIESFANEMIVNNDLKRYQGYSQFFSIILIVILFIIGMCYFRKM